MSYVTLRLGGGEGGRGDGQCERAIAVMVMVEMAIQTAATLILNDGDGKADG